MYTIKTTYNLKSLTVLARTLRKTLRKGRSIATRIFTSAVIAALLFIVAVFFMIGEAGENIVMLAFDVGIIVVLFLTMQLEDVLNGWITERQMLPNGRESEAIFGPDEYTITTANAKSIWTYQHIISICETKEYITFFLSTKHGQIFEKGGFQGRNLQEFRAFIMKKSGKAIQYTK